MAIDTRRLAGRDKDRWLELFAGYIAFYRAEVAADVMNLTFSRLLQGGDQIGIVAVDATDRPIGLAHALFHRSTWSPTLYCYLEDLFVDPASRRTGAGRALMEAVRTEAKSRAATRLYWTTQQDNAAARRLYDTFVPVSAFVQYRMSEAAISDGGQGRH